MTFYWWSHWFWITLLGNTLISGVVVVHTYPSQATSQEYNRSSKPQKLVTKLYQMTTTLTWSANGSEFSKKALDVTAETTLLQSIPTEPSIPDLDQQSDEVSPTVSAEDEDVRSTEKNQGSLEEADKEAGKGDATSGQNEYKRSAEIYNKTNADDSGGDDKVAEEVNRGSTDSLDVVDHIRDAPVHSSEILNFTNFSNIALEKQNSTNKRNNTKPSSAVVDTTPGSPALASVLAPAPSRIGGPQPALQWLNAMTARLPPSRITVDTSDYSDADRKIPFTLENVNKEEELHRAENEHRSRKSKGLSAEYKHVNRFINYSSDSKSLLARSASTASNEYAADESNISSEALSVQRAYFMDVGAISAICFTVFGICCTVGTIGVVLYRRRFLNKPQTLSEPDSSVYIDDSTMRVSDNSDEMYSLDNDSFLNSLEAMTIQNYWTDTVKHTKL